MKLGKGLLKEKTNVPVKATTTFNAPGNFVAPFGKTTVKISGRGATGNPNSGGNYAGETYAGANYTGEVYGGINPTNYPYAGVTYEQYISTLEYYTYYRVWAGGDPPPTYSTGSQTRYKSSINGPFYAPYTAYNPGSGSPVYEVFNYSGDTVISTGNSPIPQYNTVPGNPYNIATYAPYYAPYYNPYVPGNAGSPTNIGGVYFPGGPAASLAPIVSSTVTALSYTPSGISITVPAGGYVTVENI